MSNTSQDTDRADWDVIVIGSGMGGLSNAAALSRTGHKVLVLEQYQVLGGQTHSFSRGDFKWDVGVHYLSGIAPGQPEKQMLDWLCDTPIELESMGAIYDVLHIGDAKPLPLSRPYEAQIMDLKERFPDEGPAIDAWFAAVREAREAAMSAVRTHAIPHPVSDFMNWWNRGALKRWCARTTAEVAAEITDNPELRAAFCAQWADHGGRPGVASFAAHSLISHSYLEVGAWYPVGGASVIAERILPVIHAAGGEARAGVRVKQLLMEDDRVVGVETQDGETIRANKVVTTIGARDTVDELLPMGHGADDWVEAIRALPHGICHFSLFVGFEGDIEAAGATRANHWLYPTGEVDTVWTDPLSSDPPAMFVSFASLKDPAHDPGPKQAHSGELIAWADWSTVSQWENTHPSERGEAYADFKKTVETRIFERFRSYFPELAELVVFKELSTPLSTAYITGHRHGAFYGLDMTPERMLSDALRMKTPIKGLYLSGQDALTPGIPGALWGGVLCAGAIDPRVFTHMK